MTNHQKFICFTFNLHIYTSLCSTPGLAHFSHLPRPGIHHTIVTVDRMAITLRGDSPSSSFHYCPHKYHYTTIGPKNDSIQNSIQIWNIHSKNIHSIESRILLYENYSLKKMRKIIQKKQFLLIF